MENESPHPHNPDGSGMLSAEDESFLAGAGRRMYRGMWVLGAAGVVVCWLWHGWRWAGGFAAGAALSGLNFHWLHSAVRSVSEAFTAPRSGDMERSRPHAPGAAGSAIRIVLRYALIAIAGYAIFVSSFFSLEAFFIGLFLFLGAVMVEAGYEVYCGFRST